jgi:fructose-1,6-bisphosphatase/inositol monophosphatase family enzyme
MFSPRETLAFAHTLADAARAAILPYFRGGGQVENKASTGFDPVTEADKAAETVMRDLIRRQRPDDAIIGEEFDDHTGTSGWTWVLDPIDGTRAFINGWDEWCISIGLLKNNQPFIGVVFQPKINKLYVAELGKGAMCNDERLRITCEAKTITGAFPMMKPYLDEGYIRAEPIPSLALRIISVATNQHAIALASANSHDWDSAAAFLILKEAGGEIVSLQEMPFRFNKLSLKQPPFKAFFKENTP